MTCGSCGIRNVDFASTCFSCRQPLGKLGAVAPRALPVEIPEGRKHARRVPTRSNAAASSSPGGTVLRLLLVAAFAWLGARGFHLPIRLLSPDSSDEVAAPPSESRSAPADAPAPAAAVPPATEEQNGFRLVRFEWDPPAAEPGAPFRLGQTVRGRSEIQGFGVSADQTIDVTVALAFRDPLGTLVEPITPTMLRQPVESDTLYTSFDYALPAEAPAGRYDLEIAVDDAVSARSARFHRTITVEAADPR